MKDMIKIALVTIVVALISSCEMSDAEMTVYKECIDSAKKIDLYEKDGTHFSKTKEGKTFERRICLARAKLYEEGYRIGKTVKQGDYKVYQLSLMSNASVRSIYMKQIKSGIEP